MDCDCKKTKEIGTSNNVPNPSLAITGLDIQAPILKDYNNTENTKFPNDELDSYKQSSEYPYGKEPPREPYLSEYYPEQQLNIFNNLQMQEAEWNEADHPRVPAGNFNGGEFVNTNRPPTGKSKEEKNERDEYYNSSVKDNMNVLLLNEEIQLKTIDANYANMKGNFENEQKIRNEIELLKTQRTNTIKKLRDSDKLEGVQAQRALIQKQEFDDIIAKSKEGSKQWEKAKLNSHIMDMRIDMLRRGILPDYDLENNPVNQSAFLEQQEKKKTEKLMNKRPVKTHQKDLQTFKDIKNIKLGKNVDKNHVKQIEDIWNNLDPDDRKMVNSITIRGTRAGGRVTAGEWLKDSKTMEITTHPLFTDKDYSETIHHEIAHAKFQQYNEIKIQEWNDAVKSIRPPTWYAQYHQKRYQDYQFSHNRYRTEEEKQIILRNIKALENLYYEEIHSEVYANLKSPLPDKKIWSKDGLKEATEIYKRLFS